MLDFDKKNPSCFCRLQDSKDVTEILLGRDEDTGETERRIVGMLLTDPLTRLPNRARLIRDIQENPCPVLFIVNINGFSQINNFFGHKAGDAVLLAMADRLGKMFADTEPFRLYKLPADEFGILTNLVETSAECGGVKKNDIPWEQLKSLIQKLVDEIERDATPIGWEKDQQVQITLSVTVGAAVASVVGKENLLTHADIALKTAQKDKIPYLFYKEARETKGIYRKNLHWAELIREAVTQRRITPHYQPIVDNLDGKIVKFEALVRLVDSDGQIVSPGRFLELSKIIRIYPKITRIMAEKILSVLGEKEISISINVGAEDIFNAPLIAYLEKEIQAKSLGDRITFEVLESDCIEQYRAVNQFIERFKKLGCSVAIDDFGSGYSNFNHVIQMDADYLKIDASLIRELETSSTARVVVRSIVHFARALGIRTVAEGVENASIFVAVKQAGIDYSQGYYWGEPRERI